MWSFRKHGQSTPHTPVSDMGEDDGTGSLPEPDSPLERLLHAWHPASPSGSVPPPWQTRHASSRSNRHFPDTPPCRTVLLCLPPGHEALVRGLRNVWPEGEQRHRFACASPRRADELEQRLEEESPRVLVIDAGLCARLGMPTLRHLHRSFPAVEWIIGWEEPLHCPTELLIHSQARGCIAWEAPPCEVARALQAVLGGELWFSRSVMQSIYLSLLGGLRLGPEGGAMETAAPDFVPGFGLSARELEVLALTREGLTNKQIAARLDISVNTVKKHLANAFEKKGLRSRRQVLK